MPLVSPLMISCIFSYANYFPWLNSRRQQRFSCDSNPLNFITPLVVLVRNLTNTRMISHNALRFYDFDYKHFINKKGVKFLRCIHLRLPVSLTYHINKLPTNTKTRYISFYRITNFFVDLLMIYSTLFWRISNYVIDSSAHALPSDLWMRNTRETHFDIDLCFLFINRYKSNKY